MKLFVQDPRDLCLDREEDGRLVVKQEELVVLSRGQWPVVAIIFRQWDRRKGGLGPPRLSIRRFRRVGEGYVQTDQITVPPGEPMQSLRALLDRWCSG